MRHLKTKALAVLLATSATAQVRTAEQKELAASKARSIHGATKVNNELEVEGSA